MAVDAPEVVGIASIAAMSIAGFLKLFSRVLSVVDRNTAAFVEMKNVLTKHGDNLQENTQATRELRDSVKDMKQGQDQFSRTLIDAFGKR